MRIIELSGEITAAKVDSALPRAQVSIESVLPSVREIIAQARRGEAAVLDLCERYDGVRPQKLRVPQAEIDAALAAIDADLRGALTIAIDRVRAVSEANLPVSSRVELGPGATVSTRWQPVDSVGLYVPGGKAVYPSSVVMNVVPAQVAGVPRLAIASPPQQNGLPHPSVLATAGLLGVQEVYAVGGAAAIAGFAYGVESVLAPVALVTGPGNIYVAAAKRELRGVIGIDSEAGPTEILIIADSQADPKLLAADLISQAEHDENAAAVLVTTDIDLAYRVNAEIESQLATTVNVQRATAALNSPQSAITVVSDLDAAILVANHYATEHLEIQVAEPAAVAARITNAGAIFVGANAPVSLGDYLAGSNHVLPTGAAAKFSSGLGVHSFLRPQQLIEYSKAALAEVTEALVTLAETEGLPAHGRAAQLRFED